MNTVKTKIVLLSLLVMLTGIYACAHTASRAIVHPVEITTAPLCSDCHQDWRSALDHTSDYAKRHRVFAEQQSQTCAVCHKESFCSDCHAHKDELKPRRLSQPAQDRWPDRPGIVHEMPWTLE